jgi:hypothetical protein
MVYWSEQSAVTALRGCWRNVYFSPSIIYPTTFAVATNFDSNPAPYSAMLAFLASSALACYASLLPGQLFRSGIPTEARFQVSLLSQVGGGWVGVWVG